MRVSSFFERNVRPRNIEYRMLNIEYRETSLQPSPPTSLIHTHIHQRNPAGLLVHLQRQYNPPLVSLCVRRDAPTIQMSPLCIHMDAPSHKTPIKMNPSISLPHPVFCVFIMYILQETACQSVCPPNAGFHSLKILSPGGLPLMCCLATSALEGRKSTCETSHLLAVRKRRILTLFRHAINRVQKM